MTVYNRAEVSTSEGGAMSVSNDTVAPSDVAPIPEVLESEDGDTYWADGHVDSLAMVLGVVVSTMANVGAIEALEMLIRNQPRYMRGAEKDWNEVDCRHEADRLVASVRHVWRLQDPDDDEKMHPAKAGDEGAQPFTRLDL